jgi:hypothetical protein
MKPLPVELHDPMTSDPMRICPPQANRRTPSAHVPSGAVFSSICDCSCVVPAPIPPLVLLLPLGKPLVLPFPLLVVPLLPNPLLVFPLLPMPLPLLVCTSPVGNVHM